MIRPVLFLLACSWKNRVWARIKRLRQPKYLISVLAGLLYLYFVFLRGTLQYESQVPRSSSIPNPGMLNAMEIGFALILMAVILFHWFFSSSRTPLFSEPEIQFLFPAPVSRGALLNYRIAKAQIGILFGTIVSFVLFAGLFPRPGFLLITIWVLYSFLHLYRTAVLLAKQALDRSRRGRQIRIFVLLSFLLIVLAVLVSAHWIYPPLPSANKSSLQDLVEWLARVVEYGPVFYFLYPFRMLIHPAFTSLFSQFLLRLVPVLVIIAALYTLIRCSNAGLEESVLGPMLKNGLHSYRETDGMQPRITRKPRRTPFCLKPTGFAPIAIYWKNLALAGGFSARQTVPALIALTILSILVIGATGEQLPMMVGAVAIAMAGFLTIMGPVVFRDDLRTDLKYIELLKTYPISGWGLVFGEALGPATILAILQWSLLLLAAGVLPSVEEHPWKISERISVALGAALVLPCLGLIGILVQNAVVLLLPGWMNIGRENQRGIEAMGQRLISGIGTMLSLLIAAIPAALLFLATWFAGHWLIGVAIIPVAALIAALGLLAEAAIGILWLGRLFDRFDPSKEL